MKNLENIPFIAIELKLAKEQYLSESWYKRIHRDSEITCINESAISVEIQEQLNSLEYLVEDINTCILDQRSIPEHGKSWCDVTLYSKKLKLYRYRAYIDEKIALQYQNKEAVTIPLYFMNMGALQDCLQPKGVEAIEITIRAIKQECLTSGRGLQKWLKHQLKASMP